MAKRQLTQKDLDQENWERLKKEFFVGGIPGWKLTRQQLNDPKLHWTWVGDFYPQTRLNVQDKVIPRMYERRSDGILHAAYAHRVAYRLYWGRENLEAAKRITRDTDKCDRPFCIQPHHFCPMEDRRIKESEDEFRRRVGID